MNDDPFEYGGHLFVATQVTVFACSGCGVQVHPRAAEVLRQQRPTDPVTDGLLVSLLVGCKCPRPAAQH